MKDKRLLLPALLAFMGGVAWTVAASCFTVPKPECGFTCGAGGACPASYICGQDNACHLLHADGTVGSCSNSSPPAATPIDAPVAPPPSTTEPMVTTIDYAATTDSVPNPERGFYATMDPDAVGEYTNTFTQGDRLVRLLGNLRNFTSGPISEGYLASWQNYFAYARSAGVKVIARFYYSEGDIAQPAKATVLGHVQQLGTLLRANADVIAWTDAGLLGDYGGWGGSDTADENEVLAALLAQFPTDRAIALPRATELISRYATPLSAQTGHTMIDQARLSSTDDCFLGTDTDAGYYDSEAVDAQKAYLASHNLYVPMAGSTCGFDVEPPGTPVRTVCATAEAELAMMHWTSMNKSYNGDVLAAWSACMPTLRQRLGYRLVLKQADFNQTVAPGGVLRLTVRLANEGYAPPMNPRKLYVTLKPTTGKALQAETTVVPTAWVPGPHTITLRLRVPATLAGAYELGLALPDASVMLAEDARYAVAFANAGVWQSDVGLNRLGTVTVDAATSGARDAMASAFVVLPAE